jgi:hypothetical protein
MKTKDLIKGLTILQRYRKAKNGYDLGADHDVVYAYATDRPLNEEDIGRMIKLGWLQEHDGIDYDAGGEFLAKHYLQEESWIAYT